MSVVVGLLDRLLVAAESGKRIHSVIEILVLQALAHQLQRDVAGALVPLSRALELAEPEGYVRRFVDEGSDMAALLEAAATQRISPAYVARLLTAFGPAAAGPTGRAGVDAVLVEPLSERELDVLRLLSTDLNGPQIAGQLVVSLNTVRTHTKNIYAKLGVTSRREAVRQAHELDLLARQRRT